MLLVPPSPEERELCGTTPTPPVCIATELVGGVPVGGLERTL